MSYFFPFFMNSLPALLPDDWNTYAGIIVGLAPSVLSWFGIVPTPEFNAEFASTSLAVATALGGLYALYGKLRHQIPLWFAK